MMTRDPAMTDSLRHPSQQSQLQLVAYLGPACRKSQTAGVTDPSSDTTERESVLFIGTQFSNLYTAVDTPARGRVGQVVHADSGQEDTLVGKQLRPSQSCRLLLVQHDVESLSCPSLQSRQAIS